MAINWTTLRVFISSTFRDMQAERDHLVRFVFPKLRQELLQRRIHLVDVDLRWGVTSEQDALSVCREVVDECRPRFLCMLGGRYGRVPPGKTRSITADEVHYGVLDRDLTSRGFAYFYFRDPSATAAMAEVTPGEFREPAGRDGADALAKLKTAITKAGLQPFIYRAQWDGQSRRLIGLKEFGDRVYADLKQSIDQEFGPTTGEKPDEFTEENAAMEAFIEERVQRFVLGSRQPVWNELRQHAESTGGNGYLCLTGAAGSGKSALLGKFCQDYREAHPQDLVIPHFVGASPGSTDVRRTLRRLCHELVTGAALTAEIPEDPEKLRVAFAEILQQASAQKRVVILLDAINQFDSTTQLAGWSWLPEDLPASARIILSTLAGPALESLRQRRQPPRPVELQPLDEQDREAIIREFLHRYRKSMTDDQRAALLAKADAGTPLYLLVALEELRTLGTYEEITDRIAQLPPETRALFTWILKRLEDDDGFRDASGQKIGRELVSRFVSLLGASRHGLSQQELVELLSPGDPQGNVAALAQLLRPYLMERGELLDFYHGQFREAAATSYLPSEFQRLAAHDQLATYFRDLADPEKNQRWKGENPRPFLQVVFHLVGAERSDEYCQTLCDLRYVEARCRLGQVFDLIADYRLAQENLPEAQADLRMEREREERVRRWTAEIIEYAQQWSDRRDRLERGESVTEPEPVLPEPPPSCRMRTKEEITSDCKRIVENPTRLDRLSAFAGFVTGQYWPLVAHGRHSGFVFQHAFNADPTGPVHDAAAVLLRAWREPFLLRRWPAGTLPNPRPALLRTLEGHDAGVYSVSVTPDGRRAVSGSLDYTVRFWDLESGACLRTLKGHTRGVESVSVTPDGRRAVSGSSDTTLRFWDLESGTCLRTLEGHKYKVNCVSVTPDGRRAVSASNDRTVRVWDLVNGVCLRMLEGHSRSADSVSVTPDGRHAVSGDSDGTLRVWDLDSGACLRTLKAYPDPFYAHVVYSVSVTPDGQHAISASSDHTVRVSNLEKGECLHILEGHGKLVLHVSMTPDGRYAVSGSDDMTLRVWDLDSGVCLGIMGGFYAEVRAVSVTPDGRHAVSAAASTLQVWDLENVAHQPTLERHSDSVRVVDLSTDGRRAVSGSKDGTLRVWDVESGRCLYTLEGHFRGVWSVSVTPDGRRAVSGSGDAQLPVWDLENGQQLRMLEGHSDEAHVVSVTPDGRRAVSGSYDHTLRVWDLESGACLRTLEGHVGRVLGVSVTPDGLCAVSGGGDPPGAVFHADHTVRVWDLESGACLHTLEGHSGGVGSVSVTPNGWRAVSSGGTWPDTTLRVWDLQSGACLHTLADYSASLCLSPDGRYAVSGNWGGALHVWDLESGVCLRTLGGHSHSVDSVSMTPDGRRVVSGSTDKTLRVWDLESGTCLAVFSSPAPVQTLAVFYDRVVLGTASGEVFFLEVRGIESGPDLQPDTSAEGYEQLLRRGLEFSRREKGPDHAETLAHLVALAAHFEQLGQPESARPYAQEHARLTAQSAQRKKVEQPPEA